MKALRVVWGSVIVLVSAGALIGMWVMVLFSKEKPDQPWWRLLLLSLLWVYCLGFGVRKIRGPKSDAAG